MRHILGFLSFFLYQEAFANQQCIKTCPSWWEQGWAVTIYSGPITSQDSSKIFLKGRPEFERSGIVAFAGSKKLGSLLDCKLDFEVESQLVQHFGGQTHLEINPIAIVARWKAFPWNKSLPTTIAIGDGISIATRLPRHEVNRHGPKYSSRVLNYLMVEVTFSLPSLPQWALVGRYHHRSGVFGTFNGARDASTAFAAGFKYWF